MCMYIRTYVDSAVPSMYEHTYVRTHMHVYMHIAQTGSDHVRTYVLCDTLQFNCVLGSSLYVVLAKAVRSLSHF